MDSGLAVIMITDPSYSQLSLEIPQTMKDHCQYWGYSSTGNVVGLNSTTDFKGEAAGPLPLVMVSLLRVVAARFSLLLLTDVIFRVGHPRPRELWPAVSLPPWLVSPPSFGMGPNIWTKKMSRQRSGERQRSRLLPVASSE